jgi:hypothetical protein
VEEISGKVVGILLRVAEDKAAMGRGASWVLEKFPCLNNKKAYRFFDKKQPNLDYGRISCNRKEELNKMLEYFDDGLLSKTEHNHRVFLIGNGTYDEAGSLVKRFLDELKKRKNAPLISEHDIHLENEACRYIQLEPFPHRRDAIGDLEDLLKRRNDYSSNSRQFLVFCFTLDEEDWNNKHCAPALKALLDGSLFKKIGIQHSMSFLVIDKRSVQNPNFLSNIFRKKSALGENMKACCLNQLSLISDGHLRSWCMEYSGQTSLFFQKLEQKFPSLDKIWNMAQVEDFLRELIIAEVEDYQHLRS